MRNPVQPIVPLPLIRIYRGNAVMITVDMDEWRRRRIAHAEHNRQVWRPVQMGVTSVEVWDVRIHRQSRCRKDSSCWTWMAAPS